MTCPPKPEGHSGMAPANLPSLEQFRRAESRLIVAHDFCRAAGLGDHQKQLCLKYLGAAAVALGFELVPLPSDDNGGRLG